MAEATVIHGDIVNSNIFDATSVSRVGEGVKRVSLIRHLQPKAPEARRRTEGSLMALWRTLRNAVGRPEV